MAPNRVPNTRSMPLFRDSPTPVRPQKATAKPAQKGVPQPWDKAMA